ncbi:MAG: hypothetical protein ABI950_01865 [Solirubrobacteraceae bacterium]
MASTDPAKTGDQEVFGSLPSSRPERRSAKRASRTTTASSTTTAKTTAEAKVTSKPKKATKAKAKPAAKAKAAAKPRAAAKPKAAPPPRSTVPPAGYATPRSDEEPSGRGDLIGTAVQAAGELTQIGLAAGSRAISSALKRLPRP